MDKKTIITFAALLTLLALVVGSYLAAETTECEGYYEEIEAGEKDLDDLPEECEPVPKEVERQVLLQTLGDQNG